MSKNSVLHNLKEAKIGIAGNENLALPSNFRDILFRNWARIVQFTVWDHGASIEKQDVVIAPSALKLPAEMTLWQVLRWRLWNAEQTNEGEIDIDDISANGFAQKVAELIDESKFNIPEWFKWYNFKWEWSVIEHPITKERCRKIRLFKTFEEWNIREKYTHVYLDASGQFFNASKKRKSPDKSKNRFTIGKEVIDRTPVTENSEIEVHNSYRGIMVGNNEPTLKEISYFRSETKELQ